MKNAINEFDGTAIIVSHDRDFLDGLVSKVYEFMDGKVTEYLEGIYDYLNRRNIESPDELSTIKKSSVVNESPLQAETVKKKNSYAEHKELQKKIRKIEKAIKESEAKIENLENKLKVLSEKMCTPEGASDMNLISEYTSVNKQLSAEEDIWTNLSEELDEQQKELSY